MNTNQIARDICDACDEEFGGQHRTEAIKHAAALVAGYEVDKPKNEIEAYEVMRRAYREVAAKEAARTAPRRPAAERSTPFKPGTLEQVRRDIASRMKNGTYDPKAFAAT